MARPRVTISNRRTVPRPALGMVRPESFQGHRDLARLDRDLARLDRDLARLDAVRAQHPPKGNPTMSILNPKIEGGKLLVAAVMQNPLMMRAKLDKLVESQELLSTFFQPFPDPVTGGGVKHTVSKPEDRYTADDVVERAPGDEYKTVRGVDPDYRIAAVRDYGAQVEIFDEEVTRNDVATLDLKIHQLANTLTRKLNTSALAAVEEGLASAPGGGMVVTTAPWSGLTIVGPSDQITPNGQRPAADWARAQLAANEERLGIKHDVLLVSPQQESDLMIGYAETLAAVLESNKLTLQSSPYIDDGTAYVCKKGGVGYVGYEVAMTVRYIPKPENRMTLVQAFAVPSYVVDQPGAVKKLVAIT